MFVQRVILTTIAVLLCFKVHTAWAMTEIDQIPLTATMHAVEALVVADHVIVSDFGHAATALACYERVGHSHEWSASFNPGDGSLLGNKDTDSPPAFLFEAQPGSTFAAFGGLNGVCKVYDADTGAVVASALLGAVITSCTPFSTGGHHYFACVLPTEVRILSKTTLSTVMSIPLNTATPWKPALIESIGTLVIPIHDEDKIVCLEFSYSGGLQVTRSDEVANLGPRFVVDAPGQPYFYVVCEGSVGAHAKSNQQASVSFWSLSKPTDAFASTTGLVIIQSVGGNPQPLQYRSGMQNLDFSTGPGPQQWIDDVMLLEVPRITGTANLYCLNSGVISTSTGTFQPGSLIEVDPTSGSIISQLPIGGGASSTYFDSAADRLYLADPTADVVRIFQL